LIEQQERLWQTHKRLDKRAASLSRKIFASWLTFQKVRHRNPP
jgi:hypothetical protein